MPLKYWWDAFMTSTFLINGLPSTVLKEKSPMEKLLNKQLNFLDVIIFGCACYPCLRPYNSQKLQYRYERCVYLGPSSIHKGHKCLSWSARRLPHQISVSFSIFVSSLQTRDECFAPSFEGGCEGSCQANPFTIKGPWAEGR